MTAHKAHVTIMAQKYFVPAVLPNYLEVHAIFARRDSYIMSLVVMNKLQKMIVLC